MKNAIITLTRGLEAIVDADDVSFLSNYSWYAGNSKIVYARTNIGSGKDRKTVYMHCLLMNPPSGKQVDHINGNSLDNRRSNLRIASRSENMHNTHKRSNRSTHGQGIYKMKDRFYAHIRIESKWMHIGSFDNKEDASNAYFNVKNRLVPESQQKR